MLRCPMLQQCTMSLRPSSSPHFWWHHTSCSIIERWTVMVQSIKTGILHHQQQHRFNIVDSNHVLHIISRYTKYFISLLVDESFMLCITCIEWLVHISVYVLEIPLQRLCMWLHSDTMRIFVILWCRLDCIFDEGLHCDHYLISPILHFLLLRLRIRLYALWACCTSHYR